VKKIYVTVLIILVGLIGVPSVSAQSCGDNGLLLHYEFNTSSATDYSGCGHDGTISGSPDTSADSYWTFDGDDFVEIPTLGLSTSSDYSIVAEIDADTSHSDYMPVVNLKGQVDGGIRVDGSTFYHGVYDGNEYLTPEVEINDSQTTVYGLYDNQDDTIISRVENNENSLSNNGLASKNKHNTVGVRDDLQSNYYHGDVYEVRVYNETLTDTEIQNFNNCGEITCDGSNSDPSASFTYSTTGLNVTVDGSGSSDDGSISSYEWDWTSDGTYEATGETQEVKEVIQGIFIEMWIFQMVRYCLIDLITRT